MFRFVHVQEEWREGNIFETLHDNCVYIHVRLYTWCGFELSFIYSLLILLDPPPPSTCTLHVSIHACTFILHACTCMSSHYLSCWIFHSLNTCSMLALHVLHVICACTMYAICYASISNHYLSCWIPSLHACYMHTPCCYMYSTCTTGCMHVTAAIACTCTCSMDFPLTKLGGSVVCVALLLYKHV